MKSEMNIYKIAKEAGVSAPTVSRVITNSANVSPEKRERVEQVIRKYNFRPNALAQGLINARTGIIGVVAADLENPFYARLATQCVHWMDQRGYTAFVCSALRNDDLENKHINRLYDVRAEAIVLLGGRCDNLVTKPDFADLINRVSLFTPVVTTGKVDGAKCYQVNLDEMYGVELAMNHLFSLGHSRIAFVGGYNDVKSSYDKRVRYRGLVKGRGLSYREAYVVDGAYDMTGGFESCEKLLSTCRGEERPTAVIAINDACAVGAVHSITSRGLKIPDDIAVLSFDDTFISEQSLPALTSVNYDYELFGRTLTDTAISLIEGKPVQSIQQILPGLTVRESTIGKEKD